MDGLAVGLGVASAIATTAVVAPMTVHEVRKGDGFVPVALATGTGGLLALAGPDAIAEGPRSGALLLGAGIGLTLAGIPSAMLGASLSPVED